MPLSHKDQKILDAVRAGSTEEINTLTEEYWRPYQKVANKYRKELGETINDIYHETFIIFERHIISGAFKQDSGLLTFFIAIAKWNLFSELRKKNSDQKKIAKIANELKINDLDQYQKEIEFEIVDEGRIRILEDLWSNIGEDCKKRLYMFHVENYSHNEIAEIVNYEGTTTPQQIASNCRKKFRTFLIERPQLLKKLGLRPSLVEKILNEDYEQ